MHPRPPSIRDIARATGFGKSAVAAALINSTEVAAATAALIRQTAEQMGYRRDPVVADLAARRWRSRPHAASPTLAYVYDYGQEVVRSREPSPDMEQTATAYGYRLEHVNLKEFESDARASRVFASRGYRGLMVGRILRRDRPLDLEWARFTAIACDLGFVRPPLHMVLLDRFAAAEQATRKAIERGYRRPGYVHLVHSARETIDPARLGGYLAARGVLPHRNHLPVHVGLYHDDAGLPMRAWLRATRPDVVIGFNDMIHWWLVQAGARMPADIGFVAIDRAPATSPDISGVIGSNAPVYRAAVELLISQIHLNARGVPNPVQTVLVEPQWHEGATLPGR